MVEPPLRLPITPASSPEGSRLPGLEQRPGRRLGPRLAERVPLRQRLELKPLVALQVGEVGSVGYPAECQWSLTALVAARAVAAVPLVALMEAGVLALVAELLWQVRAAAMPRQAGAVRPLRIVLCGPQT